MKGCRKKLSPGNAVRKHPHVSSIAIADDMYCNDQINVNGSMSDTQLRGRVMPDLTILFSSKNMFPDLRLVIRGSL